MKNMKWKMSGFNFIKSWAGEVWHFLTSLIVERETSVLYIPGVYPVEIHGEGLQTKLSVHSSHWRLKLFPFISGLSERHLKVRFDRPPVWLEPNKELVVVHRWCFGTMKKGETAYQALQRHLSLSTPCQ